MRSKAEASRRWDVLGMVAIVLGLVLTAVAFVLTFTTAPLVNGATLSGGQTVVIGGQVVTNVQLFSQKIFYFHVPVAVASMVFVIAAAVYGVLFLVRKDPSLDRRSKACEEVGLVFILATMFSGDLWTRFEWGSWWVWEPRLTTYFILMLLVFAYFILRAAVDDPEKRARFAAVFAVVAAVDAPISFMITRMVPSSIHPVVFRTDSGLAPSMLLPFLLALFGMLLVAFGLYRLRLRVTEQAVEVEDLKRRLEELDEAPASRID
jgi:heme exporter protein C